jgi:Putative prokaryotic signal transducing protein
MIEILRTNDAVALSLAEALLQGAGIACFVADRHMSAVEGSIGAFQRRLLVDRDLEARARRILAEGGLGEYLRQGPA